MNYEAMIMDPQHGHHKTGKGASPSRAVLAAFRKIVKLQLLAAGDNDQDAEDKSGTLTTAQVHQTFLIVSPDDEYYEEPKTLKEDVHDMKILVRVDKTAENMYIPCGIVRNTF